MMPEKLKSELTLKDPDGFYAHLIELHAGLTQEQSNKLNAKIILMLANQVGDDQVLRELLEYAKNNLQEDTR